MLPLHDRLTATAPSLPRDFRPVHPALTRGDFEGDGRLLPEPGRAERVLREEASPLAAGEAQHTSAAASRSSSRKSDPRLPRLGFVVEEHTVDQAAANVEGDQRRYSEAYHVTGFEVLLEAGHRGDNYAIVSNKVSMLSDTLTHASARGSNDLIGRNVVQTMTWMTPDEYEMLQALNAWTGRRDLIGLRHIDEFNQSAGRNLGFRHRGNAKHALLINLRLLDTLLEHRAGVLGRARYGLRLRLNKNQRYESTARKVAGNTG